MLLKEFNYKSKTQSRKSDRCSMLFSLVVSCFGFKKSQLTKKNIFLIVIIKKFFRFLNLSKIANLLLIKKVCYKSKRNRKRACSCGLFFSLVVNSLV